MISFYCYAIFIHYFFAENYRACLPRFPNNVSIKTVQRHFHDFSQEVDFRQKRKFLKMHTQGKNTALSLHVSALFHPYFGHPISLFIYGITKEAKQQSYLFTIFSVLPFFSWSNNVRTNDVTIHFGERPRTSRQRWFHPIIGSNRSCSHIFNIVCHWNVGIILCVLVRGKKIIFHLFFMVIWSHFYFCVFIWFCRYMPWHGKQLNDCCGRELDNTCSHDCVLKCKEDTEACPDKCAETCPGCSNPEPLSIRARDPSWNKGINTFSSTLWRNSLLD